MDDAITLNDIIKKESNNFYATKLDAQTKLIKYFPKTLGNTISGSDVFANSSLSRD